VMPKRQFQIQALEQLKATDEYYILRFEVDKMLSMIYCHFQDMVQVQSYIYKIFTIENIDHMLSLYEIISTIRPILM
jgi:hypothetical protein